MAKASTDLEIKTQNYKRLAIEAQKKCEAVKSIETKVGTPCSECGKLYTLDDLADAKRLATKSAVKAVEIAKTALNEAKKAKNFAEADRIRDLLKAEGITIIDTPQGAKWKRD